MDIPPSVGNRGFVAVGEGVKSTWGPRLVKVGVAFAVLGVLSWVFLTSPCESAMGDPFGPGGCGGTRFLGLLALSVAPGVLVTAIGGVLVKQGYDREERARLARERRRTGA